MIVTAHQPNYLPGLSVIEKISSSDMVVWLDEAQYTKGGWTNRNRMPDGSWLTVPIVRATDGLPINRVRIAEHDQWRYKHVKAIRQHYGADEVCDEIFRPYGLLIGLNLAILRLLTDPAKWQFQSHLDGGHAVTAVSDDRAALLPISERLAMMVAEVGADVYLSGPSGFRYLDEEPFRRRGIHIDYFSWTGPNPCALEILRVAR